jgi:hypothetical protein
LGLSNAWATAIAAAITLAANLIIAPWVPADLILEDSVGFGILDLSARTSPNFPPPPEAEYTTAGGIRVLTEPESKGVDYFEWRKYRSDDSRYNILFRYSRGLIYTAIHARPLLRLRKVLDRLIEPE